MAKGRSRLVQAQKAAKKQHHQPSKRQKPNPSSAKNPNSSKPKPPPPKSHLAPTIPFSPSHAILLVGEGDLSFAASLATHHACTRLTATVYESSPAALLEKYPHASANLSALSSAGAKVLYNIDAKKMSPFLKSKSPPEGAMDRILFNFPHVGGKSTDVNRQVRHNQELLVEFFKRAMLSLAPRGKVVVTLFEGEPYTLWNVRDLGRHAGLAVERSFRFRAEAYPGYRHARTLGVVRKGGGKGAESETRWRGEERRARSYVFVRREDAPVPGAKRRKGEESESESESSGSEGEGWTGFGKDEGEEEDGEEDGDGPGEVGGEDEEREDDGGDKDGDTSKPDE